jgi:hypothetical protein
VSLNSVDWDDGQEVTSVECVLVREDELLSRLSSCQKEGWTDDGRKGGRGGVGR